MTTPSDPPMADRGQAEEPVDTERHPAAAGAPTPTESTTSTYVYDRAGTYTTPDPTQRPQKEGPAT